MKKATQGAVFFLAITLYFSFASTAFAAGDVTPTPTQTPNNTPIYGGAPVYGGAPYGGAPYGGQPVYGGGVIVPRGGQVLTDKQVQNPASGKFVDHLTHVDPKYRPEQVVTFHLLVRNPGTDVLRQIQAKDIFPKVDGKKVLDYVSSSVPANYDNATDTLTFTVGELQPGTSQTIEVKGRVVHAIQLPKDKNVICPEPGNVVEVQVGELRDRDESKFCIEKEMNVPVVPAAGPHDWMFTVIGLSAMFVAGRNLRKKLYV